MPKPTDPKLAFLGEHRDGGTRRGDTARYATIDPAAAEEDAPGASQHEGESAEILIDALRTVERGSDAERALTAALHLLVAKHGGGDGGGRGDLSRGFVAKIAAAVLGVLTLVQPTVEQVAERWLSPTSALERKLDEALVGQARLQAQQQEDRAVFIALAKWVVDVEYARENGRSMPEPPAPVRLILVQDELTRSTGP